MKKTHRNQGFTLIELLVAVALMLVLVGGVARIFKHTSDAMLLADATMTVTQNGRAMLEIMARDLASVQVGPDGSNTYLGVRAAADSDYFLQFDTITSWWNPITSTEGQGVARIRYRLVQANNRWNMMRRLSLDNGATWPNQLEELVAQYVMADGTGIPPNDTPPYNTPRLRIEYYYWETGMGGSRITNSLYLEPTTTNAPTAAPTTSGPPVTKNFHETNLPSALRLTVDLTDRRREVIRHYSQVFWIATGVQ